MKPSNKSRSRKSNNRNRGNSGNIINRVFDSAGPEGRVRGTPNQIIEKYQTLAHDATLSGDRVAAENFTQHAEHYIRILAEAQAELAREQEKRQADYEARQAKRREEQEAASAGGVQEAEVYSDIVETPEDANKSEEKPKAKPRSRAPRKKLEKPKAAEKDNAEEAAAEDSLNAENTPDFLKAVHE